jgi:ribosomal protein S18 acetylase RimI-like enzyme
LVKPLFRRMESRDLEACVEMLETVELFEDYGLRGDRARKTMELAFTSSESDIWVACNKSGAPQGFAWFNKRGGFSRSAYLRLICVSPTAQGQGVGEALIQHFERQPAFRKGLLILCTSSNGRAAAFYEGLGYQKVGLLPQFTPAGHDEIIFWKAHTKP